MAAEAPPIRFAHAAMHAEFALFVDPEDRAAASGLTGELWKRIDDLEARISSWLDTSDLGRLHAAPPGTAVKISLDTYECLMRAKHLHEATGGAFDVTLGPLIRLWRDAGKRNNPLSDMIFPP